MQRRIVINNVPVSLSGRILAGAFVVLLGFLGIIFGAVILGFGAVASLIIAVRIGWLRRHSRQPVGHSGHAVIEGEYHVLEPRDEDHVGRMHF